MSLVLIGIFGLALGSFGYTLLVAHGCVLTFGESALLVGMSCPIT